MTIKQAIENELERRGWSHYRLVKELEGKMPARTIYAYLSEKRGKRKKRDLASARASIILETLGLKITR